MRAVLRALLGAVLFLAAPLAQAQVSTPTPTDSTGYRWFACETGLAVGGTAFALTLPHLSSLEGDGEGEGSGASVLAAFGLAGLTVGLCVAGWFGGGALAEHTQADTSVGYGLGGGGAAALSGAMLGYGLGQAFDASPRDKVIAASVVGAVAGVGGYLIGARVGTDADAYVRGDQRLAPLIAHGSLFILSGITTSITVAATRDEGAPPSPALLLAPAIVSLLGHFLVGILVR